MSKIEIPNNKFQIPKENVGEKSALELIEIPKSKNQIPRGKIGRTAMVKFQEQNSKSQRGNTGGTAKLKFQKNKFQIPTVHVKGISDLGMREIPKCKNQIPRGKIGRTAMVKFQEQNSKSQLRTSGEKANWESEIGY